MNLGNCVLRQCTNRRFSPSISDFSRAFTQRSVKSIQARASTSGAIKQIENLRIEDDAKARSLVGHLNTDERNRLLEALNELARKQGGATAGKMSTEQTRQLFLINSVPFVGFGILDNMIMILAGEYIDQTLGAWLAISTMAAAALGNIISDVAGVGLAHYVEFLVSKFGFRHPVLTSEQLESSFARVVVNVGRALGLTIGCLIGMFPLLFFDPSKS